MAADDWDLSAVVRSCGSISAAADTATSLSCAPNDNPLSCLASLTFEEDNEGSFGSHSPATCVVVAPPATALFDELESLCQSFLGCPSNADPDPSRGSCPPVASFPLIPAWNYPSAPVSQTSAYHRNQPQHQEADLLGLPAVQRPASNSKSKKRKTQPKSVCHFTGETLSSDPWAWRKYGQKPIKGSPYPRSYYRCSSSKACMARKQVERSGNDPDVFVVMYTGEHSHPLPTHRNSLAGSTRNKYSSLSSSPHKKSTTSAAAPTSDDAGLSPITPQPSPGFDDATTSENNDDTIALMMDEDDNMAEDHWLIPNVGMSEEILTEYRPVSNDSTPSLTGFGHFSS